MGAVEEHLHDHQQVPEPFNLLAPGIYPVQKVRSFHVNVFCSAVIRASAPWADADQLAPESVGPAVSNFGTWLVMTVERVLAD
jgi:hypothetical protein